MFTHCLLLFIAIHAAFSAVLFEERFDSTWESRWVQSEKSSTLGTFKHTAGKWYGDKEEDKGIQTSMDARFYGISTNLPAAFTNKDKPLVIQFSVKHEQNIDCGGGYIKLLPSFDLKKFEGATEYFFMFGPDICGSTKKIHFIINYKGENLLWKKEPSAETDQLTHVYTAIIKPDNTYEVLVDNVKRESGKLEEDWSFLKPKYIPDPNESKPSDWVDEAEIDDPEDKKPAEWDDIPETIPDPEATKPEDWDDEEDGEWEAPTINNPKFKGEWKPKKIPNPKYKGVWKAKEIQNPAYVADDNLYLKENIAAIGFDLWQVKSGTIFDNIFITDSVEEAKEFYLKTSAKTKDAEKKMFDDVEESKRKVEEEERKKREADAKTTEDEDDEDEEDDAEDVKEPKRDEL